MTPSLSYFYAAKLLIDVFHDDALRLEVLWHMLQSGVRYDRVRREFYLLPESRKEAA